jgi:hypothetical protein
LILEEALASPQPDQAPPDPAFDQEPVTSPGDLWLLGKHKVICGNSLHQPTLLGSRRAAAVFTDPPYNVRIDGHATGNGAIRHRSHRGAQKRGLRGIEAYQHAPGSNKLMRTAGQSMKFDSGHVLLPAEAPWLDDYVRELTGFPGTKFDDQVDSTTLPRQEEFVHDSSKDQSCTQAGRRQGSADISSRRIWMFSRQELAATAQQRSSGRLHLYMYTDPDAGTRAYERHGAARFSEYLFENRASFLCNGNSQK